MKILFLYDFPLWGNGSGNYLRNISQELVKINHKVGIVAPEKRRFLENKIRQYQVKLPQTPVFIGHPELQGSKRYSELSDREITNIYKVFLDTTLEAVENFEPDVIHVNHLSLISWVARYIESLKGIKYIITTHGTGLSNILSNKKYLGLTEDAVRSAKAITTVSGNTRSRFLKTFGRTYAKNLHIIPGGVDMKLFPQKLNTSAINKKYKLKDKKIVLFSGRLTSEKGIRYLINAAAKIKGELFIAGDGPEKQHILQIIERKKLKNVHLLGYLMPEELTEFYYRADVLVSPSVAEEALGLSILEAMAAKTPIVTTRKGGIPSLIKSGYNGLFVRPRNSDQIAKACNRILEKDELREKMGEHAREIVEKKFTWDRTAKSFNRLYKKIAGNGKNGKRY